jgi:ATP-dependent DNA helicase RecG
MIFESKFPDPRVVREAEIYQLSAPDFRTAHRRTVATIYRPSDFEQMDRGYRSKACFQHYTFEDMQIEKCW